jgi:hypothetical protein
MIECYEHTYQINVDNTLIFNFDKIETWFLGIEV